MSAPSVVEIKRALARAGFEVYRTRGDEVQIAERPRENQIMESGVSLVAADPPRVRVVVRAQQSDFTAEGEAALFERARRVGEACVGRGYAEVAARSKPMLDPGDPTRVLDTWFEVVFEVGADGLDGALAQARWAVAIDKVASASGG